MVSLEDKAIYQARISGTPKLSAFNNLLRGKSIIVPTNSEMNEADEIYFGILSSIYSNNKNLFETHFNKKNKSNPSKESPLPFVNDDFLIFSLIVGIIKFNLDKIWINKIISLRTRNEITITYENILNQNYYSKSNLPEIVFMYLHLINQSLISSEFINTTYKNITDNINLFDNRSDLLILCSITAYDLIIEMKDQPDCSEINLIRVFERRFTKRIKFISWFSQSIIIVSLLYGAIYIISYQPEIKNFLDKFGSVWKVFGLFGISQLGNISDSFKRIMYEIILRAFGYPKGLIKYKNFNHSNK
jgi:hypothetical protein